MPENPKLKPEACFITVNDPLLSDYSDPSSFRFQFDDEGLGVIQAGQETQNVFVGGTNKWSYDAFVNWEFWFPAFPVLVYFKVRRQLAAPTGTLLIRRTWERKRFHPCRGTAAVNDLCSEPWPHLTASP